MPDYCVQYIGFNAECGDDAVGVRDGMPLCQHHLQSFDAFEAWATRYNLQHEVPC